MSEHQLYSVKYVKGLEAVRDAAIALDVKPVADGETDNVPIFNLIMALANKDIEVNDE